MVKIHIENHKNFQDQYLATLKDELTKRVECLLTAILHLESGTIDMTNPDQQKVSYYTRHLTKIIDGTQFKSETDYAKARYVGTVNNFIAASIHISKFNFNIVKGLLVCLLAGNSYLLEKLLVCPPALLIKAERILTARFKITNNSDWKVLKLVFSTELESFWDLIKDFYRIHLPLYACPYCNRQVVIPINNSLKFVTAAPLDHFFDQSRHPLICFCLYNLVPSDTDCNSTNKGTKEFKDEYHMNPYEDGFGKDVRFSAVIDPPNSIREIDLVLSQTICPKKAKRVLGDVLQYDYKNMNGNMNVFQLKTLYSHSYYKKKAAKAITKFKNMNTAKSSITKFLHLLPLNSERAKKAYVRWYFDKLDTPFYEKEFQNEILSKMTRDLHDEYYAKVRNPLNYYIKDLINSNEEDEIN